MTVKGYADLADLPEDERIRATVKWAKDHPGDVVGVFVDAKPKGKALRYQRKLKAGGLDIIDAKPGSVAGSTLIRCRAKVH